MQEKCDGTGSCWIYDTEFISVAIVWTGVIVKGVSTLCFLIIYIMYRHPSSEEDEDPITMDVSQHPTTQMTVDDFLYVNDATSKTYI